MCGSLLHVWITYPNPLAWVFFLHHLMNESTRLHIDLEFHEFWLLDNQDYIICII